MKPRQIDEEGARRLRQDGVWSPSAILEMLGPAQSESEYLSRLVVACALIQGVHCVIRLTHRLLELGAIAAPRMEQMQSDQALISQKPRLRALLQGLKKARVELVQTRARAQNDLDGESLNPDGLRAVDLQILVEHTRCVILAAEVSPRRNRTGVEFAASICSVSPTQRFAEDWLERALGSSVMHGILLYLPPEYGRVVVVYDDGRLAYDPAARLEKVSASRKTP